MEIEKLRTLQDWLPRRDQAPRGKPIDFEVAGIPARIQLWGDALEETERFLLEYLKDYLPGSSPREPEAVIHFYTPSNEFASVSHPFWNELDAEFRVWPQADGSNLLIQRDFIASVNADGSETWAQGPKLGTGTTDTIDNLLMFVLSRQLPKHRALALHASSVEKDGAAYVFYGVSGAGKSTLACHCFETDGLRVLSGDQIYLKTSPSGLIAHPCPTTIPEFPRGHIGRLFEPRPVKGVIHLVQNGTHSFRRLDRIEALQNFLRQTIYQQHFGNSDQLLELAIEMLSAPGVLIGEMSYRKGSSFWSLLNPSATNP